MGKKDSPSTKGKSTKSRKPLKGYMLFSKLNRKKVKADNPDISFGGIGKKLGEMWREMAEDEKEKYNKPENFADELEAEDD